MQTEAAQNVADMFSERIREAFLERPDLPWNASRLCLGTVINKEQGTLQCAIEMLPEHKRHAFENLLCYCTILVCSTWDARKDLSDDKDDMDT
jgi:hypothetical protein